MITATDSANFMALIKSHEDLVAEIKRLSALYFKETLIVGEPTVRLEQIGNALDDLQLPIEGNVKQLKAFLDHAEQNHRQCEGAPEGLPT